MVSAGLTRLVRGRTLPSETKSPFHAVHLAVRIDDTGGGIAAGDQAADGVRRSRQPRRTAGTGEARVQQPQFEIVNAGLMFVVRSV